MDEIQSAVGPLLKSSGFRKRGRTYNRVNADGLVHVINFQMGASDPPGTTYIRGLRENLHGLFTVNLGVYIPEVARRHGGGEAKAFVQDYHCSLRARLGDLSGAREDIWWHASVDASVVDDISRRLRGDALPFFARLSDRQSVLDNWPRVSADTGPGAGGPWRIVAAIMLAERGDLEAASELLREQARETHNPRHPEYVRKLAQDLGATWRDG